MRKLTTIAVALYVLLGPMAVAPIGAVPSEAAARETSALENLMTPLPATAVACRGDAAGAGVSNAAAANGCPTDRCISALEDTAEHVMNAIVFRAAEITAIAPAAYAMTLWIGKTAEGIAASDLMVPPDSFAFLETIVLRV